MPEGIFDKLRPDKVLDKTADKILEDPTALLTNYTNYADLITDILPTLPWEFPIPIPRGIYDRTSIRDLIKKE